MKIRAYFVENKQLDMAQNSILTKYLVGRCEYRPKSVVRFAHRI